jgi:hypothetical protein
VGRAPHAHGREQGADREDAREFRHDVSLGPPAPGWARPVSAQCAQALTPG